MNKRIGIIGDNSPEYVSILLDIWKEHNCAVIIDWRIPFNKIQEMLIDADVHKCYISKELLEKNDNNIRGIDFIQYTKSSNIKLLSNNICNKFEPNYSEDEAVILHSSGTTGKSKGIVLSYFAINTNADSIIDYLKVDNNDCIYIAKTLAHSSTLIGELLVGLKAKMRIILSQTIISTSTTLENMKKYGCSILCINPTLLRIYIMAANINNYDFSSLKKIYTYGAYADKSLIEEAKKTFINAGVFNAYGLTEGGPIVTAQYDGDETHVIGSSGKPIKNVEVKIIDEVGIELPPMTKGIIHIKTPSRFLKYTDNGEIRKSLYRDWLNTGDVGYMDFYKNLFIVGRSDDMIIIGSHNVYPEGVEDTILASHYVNDSIVFGVKDDIYGERIICCYISDDEVVEQKLKQFCRDNLASYEIPNEFIKINHIPVNLNGKKSRKLLQEYYTEGKINTL